MGGSGAKSRRRNQRHDKLQHDGGGGSRRDHREEPATGTDRRNSDRRKDSKAFGTARDRSRSPPQKSAAKKGSKVSKKPKHLKRKLEALDDEDPKKRELLQEMEQFEQRKKGTHAKNQNHQLPERQQQQECQHKHLKKKTKQNTNLIQEQQQRNETPGLRDEQPTRKGKDDRLHEEKQEKPSSTAAAHKKPAAPDRISCSDGHDSDTAVSVEETTTIATGLQDEHATKGSSKEDRPREEEGGKPISAAAASEESAAHDRVSSDGCDSDSDASLEEMGPKVARRQRGKGRRGRKDTSEVAAREEGETKKGEKRPAPGEKVEGGGSRPVAEKKPRYCIGRKPVTDFVVGQKYDGKVVYVRPFGIFIDIGCHSDAFCHVSRLRDGFIESSEALYSEGDAVVGARVVEIDRQRKRITVSLQTEARAADEVQSAEARRERLQGRLRRDQTKHRDRKPRPRERGNEKNAGVGPTAGKRGSRVVKFGDAVTGPDSSLPEKGLNHMRSREGLATGGWISTSNNNDDRNNTKAADDGQHLPRHRHHYARTGSNDPFSSGGNNMKPESEMTAQELKRARKLARRAARRAERAEGDGGAAEDETNARD